MGNNFVAERARQRADAWSRNQWVIESDYKWTYTRDRGPDSWHIYYPAAGGRHQSPVDIDPEVAEFDTDFATYPLKISYVTSPPMFLCNTGSSAQVNMKDSSCYISGGPLPSGEKYILKQFHFHWGQKDDCGSEHTLNQKAFAAELHLVHWNCSRFSTYEQASQSQGGLAVFAVFLELGQQNHALSQIIEVLQHIRHKNDSVNISFSPASLLPGDVSQYWTYQGSLTTPPCYESVTWIIFQDPSPISFHQVGQFRQLRSHPHGRYAADEHGGHILENFRPVQEMGSRKLYVMQHNFFTARDISHQYQDQAMFTHTRPEIMCQYNRQGLLFTGVTGRKYKDGD